MTREDLYWRAAMSGGRANLRSRRARKANFSAQLGDVSAVHPMGAPLLRLFVVECKFYKSLKFAQIVFGRKGNLDRMWDKLTGECSRADSLRHPLLIVKQNRQPVLAITNKAGLEILNAAADRRLPVTAVFPKYGARVVFFRDVLAEVKFSRIRARHTIPGRKRLPLARHG